MPQYQCHKRVRALKIAATEAMKDGSVIITPEDESFQPFRVTPGYVDKHDPLPGGYFVLYEDGYESFSPAEAFEDGYTRISEDAEA